MNSGSVESVFAALWALTVVGWAISAVRWRRREEWLERLQGEIEKGHKAVADRLRKELAEADEERDRWAASWDGAVSRIVTLQEALLRWVSPRATVDALVAYDPRVNTVAESRAPVSSISPEDEKRDSEEVR